MNIYPLSNAALKIICFAKNPIKGGTPKNKVPARLEAKKGFI